MSDNTRILFVAIFLSVSVPALVLVCGELLRREFRKGRD